MAKTLITYADKVTGGIAKAVHAEQWWFDDANEVKNAIDSNATELYDRTDGNIPSQLYTAKVNWGNLSSTVQEQDLIWAAVNADPTTIVLHDHILRFRTIRKVYGQVGSIDTYDIIENIWALRHKLTVTDGANVSLGSGNTLLSETNGILIPSGRKVTKVVGGVTQEGGFTRDFGVTGATPIEDSVNAGAIAYPSKGLYLFKGNDGTDDYLYIYEGDALSIGTGSGVTTAASDFSILTEVNADPADTSAQTIKLIGDNAIPLEAPLAMDFVGANVTQDPVTDHAIVTITASSGGNKTYAPITLSDIAVLTELNALTGMNENDSVVVLNYLNQKVNYQYVSSAWKRITDLTVDCVVRYNETTSLFEFIDSGLHTPIGVSGITTDPTASFQFSVQHGDGVRIGSIIAGVDEEFAERGHFIGASVANDESFFTITKNGFNVRCQYSSNALGSGSPGIVINEDPSSLLKRVDMTVSHNETTGQTTFTLVDIVTRINSSWQATPQGTNTTLRPQVVSQTTTSCVVEWYDQATNAQQLTLSTSMRAVISNLGMYAIPSDRVSDVGNYWIKGLFPAD